jgi:hypothetical protein
MGGMLIAEADSAAAAFEATASFADLLEFNMVAVEVLSGCQAVDGDARPGVAAEGVVGDGVAVDRVARRRRRRDDAAVGAGGPVVLQNVRRSTPD